MADEPQVIAEGDVAPPIEVEMSAGGRFSLAEQRGKWVVVYFFPRANTPG